MSTAVATRVRAGAWSVDRAHSKVACAVKHMGIANVRGEFEGTLEIGNDLSSAKVYGKVNAQSVDTNEPRRDEHLRSPDFLDAARFPEIAFESSRIEALDGDRFRITGRLTIHGVTTSSCFTRACTEPIPTSTATSASASKSRARSRAATTA